MAVSPVNLAKRLEPVPVRASKTYRLVATAYPPVNLYADLPVPPEDWPLLQQIEGLTNPRLRDERGELPLIPPDRRARGPGAAYSNAPFVHPYPSRFSDGAYGVYYCAGGEDTAIREVAFHRGRLLRATREPPQSLVFSSIRAAIRGRGFDVYELRYGVLRSDDYNWCQDFGRAARNRGDVDVLRYESVRHRGHPAYAVFWPRIVRNARHERYIEMGWDGERITHWSRVGGAL